MSALFRGEPHVYAGPCDRCGERAEACWVHEEAGSPVRSVELRYCFACALQPMTAILADAAAAHGLDSHFAFVAVKAAFDHAAECAWRQRLAHDKRHS